MMKTNSEMKSKRVSKNKKKNWRKHVDVNEVEEFLDNARHDERVGANISAREDDLIFSISKEPDVAAIKELERKEKNFLDSLSCTKKIGQYTKVQVPIMITKLNSLKTHARFEKIVKGINKSEEIEETPKKPLVSKSTKFYDIWDEPCKPTLSHLANKSSNNMPLAPVDIPHPGCSYNPLPADHARLLASLAEKEIEFEKEQKKLNAVTVKVPLEELKKTEDQELRQGLGLGKEADGDDEQELPIFKRKQPKRKLMKDRKKEKQRKQEIAKDLRKKSDLQADRQVERIKSIKKEVALREQELAERSKVRAERKALAVPTRPMTRNAFHESEPAWVLPSQVPQSLRKLSAQGNIMEDRFKSLQARNMVGIGAGPLRAKPKRKFKKKKYPRKSCA